MLYWKICHVYTWFELLFDVVDVVDDVVATTRRQRLTQLIILNTQIQTNQRQCQCQQQLYIAHNRKACSALCTPAKREKKTFQVPAKTVDIMRSVESLRFIVLFK